MSEFAEDFCQGCVFDLFQGVAYMAVKFDFTSSVSAFEKIQNFSLTFRKFDCTVVEFANFAEDININYPFLAVKAD